MRRTAAAALLLLLPLLARATTFSTNASDLWYDPAESGWGVNVVQQDNTLFATLFVYGANGRPAWYVGPALTYTGTSGGAMAFAGAWYETTGPHFAGAFDPAHVGIRQVGTATFFLNTITTATLAYTVDNVSVRKDLVRQTWRVNDLAGSYLGQSTGTYSGCGSNGYREGQLLFDITQASGEVSIALTDVFGTCTFSGTYAQAGRMGRVDADGGACGSIDATEVDANVSGITFRLEWRIDSTCTFNGRVAAARRGG